MDIHAPDKPVHSWREFAVHIGIVTIGILIALGLDGVREHFHERRLVREMRENVRFEMDANQKHMRDELASVTKFRDVAKQIADGMPANVREHPDQVLAAINARSNPGYFFATSSWQTALSTGALAHVSTNEVAAYAYAADGMKRYTELQADAQRQETLTKAYLAAYPHPSGDQLAMAMENVLLLYRAEEALTLVGPQVQADIDRALRAAGE
jgi:hypothetical protein